MPTICQARQPNESFPFHLPNIPAPECSVSTYSIFHFWCLILFDASFQTALDYRLAPETCFPGPLHDAVSAYFRLTEELHIPPENIILSGDSAGGGLCLALLMYLRDNDYPLPSGAILMSPWVGKQRRL